MAISTFGKTMGNKSASRRSFNYDNNFEPRLAFNKRELVLILTVYSRMVALGEWRDYKISMLKDLSVFSIYKHASEHPIYRVKKVPQGANKVGRFSVVAMDGRILTRGCDLAKVLGTFQTRLLRIVK